MAGGHDKKSNKYPLYGDKTKDFEDFKLVAEIMKSKGHLTVEGLEQIRNLKAGMNTGRPLDSSKIC
jgi:hypothetical protein